MFQDTISLAAMADALSLSAEYRVRRVNLSRWPYARTRRAATGSPPLRDEPPVSYGVSARGRPRSRLAGGLGLAHCRRGSVEFVVMIYRNQPPR